MLNDLIFDLSRYPSVAIFGFGREGRSFYDFAKKYLPNATLRIVDKNEPVEIQGDEKVSIFSGDGYLEGLSGVDLVVKSPGISLYNLGIAHDQYNFTSTTELFIKHYKKQIIGVTGTKGKSTLVSVMYDLFKNDGRKVVLCGNIGTPAFETLESVDDETLIVMELSSHQLHNIKHSPRVAILTNLFEEHLDYYKSLREYYEAKFNVMRFQNSDDIVILNLKEPYEELKAEIFQTARVYNVFENELKRKVEFNMRNGFIHTSSLRLLEKIAEIFGVDAEIYLKTIREFKTLPHRLEYVATICGISFINDSISTIPEATIEAVKILKDVETLILGGHNRGIHYDSLVDFLATCDVENIVFFSDTGKIIFDKISARKRSPNLHYMKSLRECVEKAYEIAKQENSIALFSPAASSFNQYKNFMERGDEFKNAVKEIGAKREC